MTNEQTFSRKIEELLYAARLEMQYSKKDILEGYLNTIYFGHGIYGVASASEFFFGKDMKDLSIAQTAMLVGIPMVLHFTPLMSMKNMRKNVKT